MWEDRPRACGADASNCSEAGSGQGSPPRMRGGLRLATDADSRKGFTPARG
ncbi:hypothetical protein GCM10027161_64230 [Microbispora hainanensis]